MSGPAIVLIGMRGSGKTTVGRLLAERLNWPFIDTDARIELTAGAPVREIFRQKGEPAFRELENRVIRGLVVESPTVIASGGGSIVDWHNRDVLRALGSLVYLNPPPPTLQQRLALEEKLGRERPALLGSNAIGEVMELMRQRGPIYELIADLRVDGDLSPEETADWIIRKLKLRAPTAL